MKPCLSIHSCQHHDSQVRAVWLYQRSAHGKDIKSPDEAASIARSARLRCVVSLLAFEFKSLHSELSSTVRSREPLSRDIMRSRSWISQKYYRCLTAFECLRLKLLRNKPCTNLKFQCHENLPACHNCIKVKLECEYPQAYRFALDKVQGYEWPVLHPQDLQLQTSPTVFSLTDMRLFHHFLGTAYPQLPLGNDKVWVTDIASLSHSVY